MEKRSGDRGAFFCLPHDSANIKKLVYICAAMEKFELHILGCGSALPTTRHFATSQVVNLREKLFMIDCGEGAQMHFKTGMKKSYKVYAAEIYNLEMICAKENGGKEKSLPPLM